MSKKMLSSQVPRDLFKSHRGTKKTRIFNLFFVLLPAFWLFCPTVPHMEYIQFFYSIILKIIRCGEIQNFSDLDLS